MTKRHRRNTPTATRRRIWKLAASFADGRDVDDYAPAAVLFDLLHASTRTPVDLCEHAPATDGTAVAMFDATNRAVRCPRCALDSITPDSEALMNEDVWCDICGVDTSIRPLADGGGTGCIMYPYGQLDAVIWLCIDCEPFFASFARLPDPDGSTLRIVFGPLTEADD